MKTYTNERQAAHYDALAKVYGITNVEAFARAARRYEVKLQRLAELEAGNEYLYRWAEREAEKTEAAARRNLQKYCRYYKKFAADLITNGDPRGYALKLPRSVWRSGIRTDFGGNVCLAPEF